MMIPHFKSIRIFTFCPVDWDMQTEGPNKRGRHQLKTIVKALKERDFRLLYMCTKPGPISRQTAWHILDKMDRARAKITIDEFAELKRASTISPLARGKVSEVLTSDQIQTGKHQVEQGLTKIAQRAVFRCLNLTSKRAETERQDVLVVADNCWLELASLEPQSTPFGLESGQGLIYTLQTTWQVPNAQPSERINVRSTVVDCEPIGWNR